MIDVARIVGESVLVCVGAQLAADIENAGWRFTLEGRELATSEVAVELLPIWLLVAAECSTIDTLLSWRIDMDAMCSVVPRLDTKKLTKACFDILAMCRSSYSQEFLANHPVPLDAVYAGWKKVFAQGDKVVDGKPIGEPAATSKHTTHLRVIRGSKVVGGKPIGEPAATSKRTTHLRVIRGSHS